jgi:Zn-dependent protease
VSQVPPEMERRMRNLQAVARHHAQRNGAPQATAQAGTGPGISRKWAKRLGTLGPTGVVLLFVLGKLKFIAPLLKLTKLSTFLSMFLAVWVYAMYWGLPFAVGFVLLIFVHEMGHAIVMRRLGIAAGAPVFIPFVGAVIAMKGMPRNAHVEALVGLGGPVLGSVGALVCLVFGWLTGSLFWYSLASTGFLINLFNLIPISPLDGGRIVGVLSRWIWGLGYALGIAIFLTTWSPILFLILLLGLFTLPQTLRGPREGYFDVTSGQRLAVGGAYFGLIAALAVGMWLADQPLEAFRASLQ